MAAPSGQGGANSRQEITVDWNYREVYKNVVDLPDKIDRALHATLQYEAQGLESYMKQHAPWTDQTSNARNGLAAKANKVADLKHDIVLYHQVPYGIWLELRHSGRYAIIKPTMEAKHDDVFKAVADVLKRIT